MKKISLFAIAVLLSIFSLHCGYSTRSNLPGQLRSIYIETFKNKITYTAEGKRTLYLPLLEQKVRNAIISRYLFDGNLRIAESPESADLVLKGELLNYERSGLRYTDNNDVQEYRIQITVSLNMWDTHKQEARWNEPSFVGETDYFVTGTQAISEDAALEKATLDLARRIVERTVEDW